MGTYVVSDIEYLSALQQNQGKPRTLAVPRHHSCSLRLASDSFRCLVHCLRHTHRLESWFYRSNAPCIRDPGRPDRPTGRIILVYYQTAVLR